MATEKHDIEIGVDVKGTEEVEKLGKESQKTGNELDETSKKSKKFSISMGQLKVALLAVIAVVVKVIATFAKQQAALGRLDTAYKRAKQSTDDYRRAVDQVRKSSDDYGVRIEEGADAMRRLIAASGDATTAQEDYALAVDIAAQENIALSEAAEALAKARKGEFEELKKFTGFSKRGAEALTKQEDAAYATAIAIKTLRQEYGGAAEANKGLEDEIKSTTVTLENVTASIGEAATGIGDLLASILGLESGNNVLTTMETVFSNIGKEARTAAQNVSDFYRGVASFVSGDERNDASEAYRQRGLQALSRGDIDGFLGGARDQVIAQGRGTQAEIDAREAAKKKKRQTNEFVGPPSPSPTELLARKEAEKEEAEERKKKAEEAEKERRARQQDIELRKKAIEILKAEGEITKRKLEHERELIEISHQDLNNEQRKLAIKEAELRLAQDLDEIEQRKEKAAMDGIVEQQLAYYDDLKAKQKEQANWAQSVVNQQVASYAGLEEQQLATKEAEQERINVGFAAAQGAADLAGMFIEGEEKKAFMQGLIDAARSVSAFASGNPVGGAGFASSSAMFFAAAGKGATSGGANAPDPGRAGGRSFAGERASYARATMDREPRNTTVNLTIDSTWPASPKQSREVADVLERELRTRSGWGGAR